MKKVLVLCTGNSCRSQMAEGFLRAYAGDTAQIYSAGIEAHGVNPLAITAMAECGIDISTHTSNQVEEYAGIEFDIILTVCDHAREHCPYIPSKALRLHRSFPDPAMATGSQEEILAVFLRVRDLIGNFCQEFVQTYLEGATRK